MECKKSLRAERDLISIYKYTYVTFGEQQAETYLRELEGVFTLIGEHPRIGRVVSGQIRQFVHGSHIIFYRLDANRVLISKIVHGAQRRG